MPTDMARSKWRACCCAEGARWLAVSSVDEGVQLRGGGIHDARILVMGGFLAYEGDAVVEYDLTPAVHSLAQIRDVDRLAAASGKPIRYHLKIDSGMGRLGTRASAAEILSTLAGTHHARLEGLMTHFASAADYTSPQTATQLAYFHDICEALRASGITAQHLHTSSTNAIGYGRTEGWHTLVRAGHALYGYVSPARGDAPRQLLDVKPALTWKAKLLAVKEIPEGALVGYGGSFRAPRAHAHRDPRSRVRGRHISPPVESREGNRRWETHTHPGHRFDGPDDHRSQPHHGARCRATKSPCSGRRANVRSMHSNSPRWPGPSPTTFFAASAPGYGECTFNPAMQPGLSETATELQKKQRVCTWKCVNPVIE